ncbi:MAG TPA: radical SAM protein [Anaeromyxobacteraceae bacterium]|nr:radical SAM protein [Anaeromyxobacteraceae bacterium]
MLPTPWRVTFVGNPDECNLRCPMCATHSDEARAARPPGPPRRLALAAVLGALDALPAPPREVVASTRGEPLLWDGLPGLAAACGERGIRLNVTTNGSWPGPGAEGWARLVCPVASDVKVSWGALDPEVDRAIMGGRDPARARDDLRTFVRVRDELAAAGGNRCGVSLQVAAREENVDGLPGLVRMAAEEGLDRVKVNHLQLHFPSLRASSLRRSAEAARRWNAAVTACTAAAAQAPRRGGGRVRIEGLVPLPADGAPPPRGECPFVGREAWVEVDGRYLPCPAPAAREGRLPALGSLAELPLGEAWRGSAWRTLDAGWRDLDACRDCPFRSPGGA